MAALAGSELVFTLDSQSCSNEISSGLLENCVKVQPSTKSQPYEWLSRGGLCAANWQGVEETRFQRTVREQLLKSQQVQQLMLLPHGNVFLPGQACGSHSSSPPSLKEFCLALRLQGLDARLFLPVPLPGSGCGRQSTGGGGQCATGGGKRCFFCSRQPYAIVRCPPAWQMGEEDWGAGGRRQKSCEQRQQQLRTATVGVSEPPTDSGAAPPPPPLVLVVEPCLRELFRVAPSTPEYAAVVEELPQVWVGPRAALLDLAERMCGAMAINFGSQGLDVPPWRRRAAVLSRWDERNHHEVALPEPETQQPPGSLSGAAHGPRQCNRAACIHASSTAAAAPAGGVGPAGAVVPVSAVRSASASADATEGPCWPHKSAATGSACGPCGPACGVVAPELAAPAAPPGALRSGRVGDVQRASGCRGCVQERPAPVVAGRALAPPLVVYGFDLPRPASAV